MPPLNEIDLLSEEEEEMKRKNKAEIEEMIAKAARPSVSSTACCALALLHGNNDTKLGDLLSFLEQLKAEATERDWKKSAHSGGWTALMAVAVMPYEQAYANTLREAGLVPLVRIGRRKGYPKGTNLIHMYPLVKIDE